MYGFAAALRAKTCKDMRICAQARNDRVRAIVQTAAVAPRTHDQPSVTRNAVDHVVVVLPNRIDDIAQYARFDAAIGEEIDQHERIESPSLRITDTAP